MRALRRLAKHLFVYALFLTGALRRAKRHAVRQGAVAVLTLHRVLPDEEFQNTSSLPGIVVRQDTFAALLECLRRYFHPVAADQVPAEESGVPRVALTFDDGWSDNLAIAAPMLRRWRIPALIFVCPGLMGKSFPFWPERAIAAWRMKHGPNVVEVERFVEGLKQNAPAERARILATLPAPDPDLLCVQEPLNATFSADSIQALLDSGIAIGSHTYSHQILTQLDLQTAERELVLSRMGLENLLGRTCETFAYPNGNWTPELRAAALQAGYRLAFTTELGLWTGASHPLSIPRVNISQSHITGLFGRFSRAMFEYTVFWRTRHQIQPRTP